MVAGSLSKAQTKMSYNNLKGQQYKRDARNSENRSAVK